MDWLLANWDSISTIVTIIATIAFPVAVPYIAVINKAKKELLDTIDAAPTKNKTFKALAKTAGKKHAARLLAKLVD